VKGIAMNDKQINEINELIDAATNLSCKLQNASHDELIDSKVAQRMISSLNSFAQKLYRSI
jgi:hypothetical protein